jgi:hypothetical protein
MSNPDSLTVLKVKFLEGYLHGLVDLFVRWQFHLTPRQDDVHERVFAPAILEGEGFHFGGYVVLKMDVSHTDMRHALPVPAIADKGLEAALAVASWVSDDADHGASFS